MIWVFISRPRPQSVPSPCYSGCLSPFWAFTAVSGASFQHQKLPQSPVLPCHLHGNASSSRATAAKRVYLYKYPYTQKENTCFFKNNATSRFLLTPKTLQIAVQSLLITPLNGVMRPANGLQALRFSRGWKRSGLQ